MITDPNILAGLICPYCGNPTEHVEDIEIYGRSFGGMSYWCRECDAYVGCHKQRPNQALGRLANAELRAAKIQAHYYFDNLWQRKISKDISKFHARGKGYRWLSEQMGLEAKYCHIGMFDVAECNQVIELCKPYFK